MNRDQAMFALEVIRLYTSVGQVWQPPDELKEAYHEACRVVRDYLKGPAPTAKPAYVERLDYLTRVLTDKPSPALNQCESTCTPKLRCELRAGHEGVHRGGRYTWGATATPVSFEDVTAGAGCEADVSEPTAEEVEYLKRVADSQNRMFSACVSKPYEVASESDEVEKYLTAEEDTEEAALNSDDLEQAWSGSDDSAPLGSAAPAGAYTAGFADQRCKEERDDGRCILNDGHPGSHRLVGGKEWEG